MDRVKKSIKRRHFSLKSKHDIVKRLQTGAKQSELCSELKLSKSTIATIWANRERIQAAFVHENPNIQKLRKPQHEKLDQSLLKWFTQQRSSGVTINGPILKSKAEELGNKLGDDGNEFTCSRSWIERFKKRHNIASGKISGEAASVDMNVVAEWLRNKWPTIRQHFHNDDIFNADETGLFYKLTPDKTLKFKGERCRGGKLSKDRITVLVCANLTGNEKRRLLVIGKSRNPRCFKNVKRLPVSYEANRKSWMTSEIFSKELREWDDELRRKKRKVLLLVDNCPAHPELNLEYIKLVFMPPNTSSVLQPMDQGVIRSLKSHYRKILLSRMVNIIDQGQQFSMNLLDGINLIHMAWQRVTPKTIRNCFKHGGFCKTNQDDFDLEDELPLSEWLKISDGSKDIASEDVEILEGTSTEDNEIFDAYVRVDDDLVTSERLTDDEIVNSVLSMNDDNSSEDDGEQSQEQDEGDLVQPLSIQGARQAVTDLRIFLQSRNTEQTIFNALAQVELHVNELGHTNLAQTRITDFFK